MTARETPFLDALADKTALRAHKGSTLRALEAEGTIRRDGPDLEADQAVSSERTRQPLFRIESADVTLRGALPPE